MLEYNHNSFDLIKLYKNNILQNIQAVYYKGIFIWPDVIKSCYASGMWIDTYPWTDDTPWKDK